MWVDKMAGEEDKDKSFGDMYRPPKNPKAGSGDERTPISNKIDEVLLNTRGVTDRVVAEQLRKFLHDMREQVAETELDLRKFWDLYYDEIKCLCCDEGQDGADCTCTDEHRGRIAELKAEVEEYDAALKTWTREHGAAEDGSLRMKCVPVARLKEAEGALRCTSCNKRVGAYREGHGYIVRAFIECPECAGMEDAKPGSPVEVGDAEMAIVHPSGVFIILPLRSMKELQDIVRRLEAGIKGFLVVSGPARVHPTKMNLYQKSLPIEPILQELSEVMPAQEDIEPTLPSDSEPKEDLCPECGKKLALRGGYLVCLVPPGCGYEHAYIPDSSEYSASEPPAPGYHPTEDDVAEDKGPPDDDPDRGEEALYSEPDSPGEDEVTSWPSFPETLTRCQPKPEDKDPDLDIPNDEPIPEDDPNPPDHRDEEPHPDEEGVKLDSDGMKPGHSIITGVPIKDDNEEGGPI